MVADGEVSAASVEAAVKAVRRGEIDYKTFCERVLDAGYHVHIAGKRVVYYGRSGDSPIEYFPGSR